MEGANDERVISHERKAYSQASHRRSRLSLFQGILRLPIHRLPLQAGPAMWRQS